MKSDYLFSGKLKDGRDVTLRHVLEEDAAAMIELVTTVIAETRFVTREPGEFDMSLEQEAKHLRKVYENEQRFWLVAVVDGRIVGSCEAGIVSSRLRFRHRANMGISVIKEFWGLGIGRMMLGEIINWCKNAGFEQLELGVVADNARAISLYKSFGFEITGTVPRQMKYPDGTYADEYLMTLFLK